MDSIFLGNKEIIEYRELRIEDATVIVALELDMHDESLLPGEQLIAECLSDSIEDGSALSFGMFKAGELVGYLLCFGREFSYFVQYEHA